MKFKRGKKWKQHNKLKLFTVVRSIVPDEQAARSNHMNFMHTAYRKHKFRLTAIMMIIVILMVSFPVVKSNSLRAFATSDTKEKLEEAEKEKEKKEEELASAQKQLQDTQTNIDALQGVKNSYQGQMNLLNNEMQLVADNLAVMETRIDLKEMEIRETQDALSEAIAVKDQQYESMKKRIQFMYERGNRVYLEYILSADSFGEFLNFADYVQKLNDYDRRMLEEYKETEETIAFQESQLEEELQQLQGLREEIVAEQQKVDGLIRDTATNLAQTVDSIDNLEAEADAYEAECDQKAAEAAAAAQEYEKIKAQYEEELRLSRLAAQSSWRDISQVSFEESDRYLLANLIYCEAGAEPYAGKLAVGAVVINRVLSSVYPDTVTGVIYQNKQFSPVLDGHLALALAENRATESCYEAADAAMAGNTNVGNCVYFRTPIEGLTGIEIGGHIFY